jgi:RNAse (barnase) inhibitor barstar
MIRLPHILRNYIWECLRAAFGFPDFFGKNWDAFWDLLSKVCPAHMVTVIGANKLPPNWITWKGIHYAEMTRHILQKNKEYKEKYHYEFDYEFIDA